MKNLIMLTALVAALTAVAPAQNVPATKLFFCPPSTCLYYAGDQGADAIFDFDNPGIGVTDAEVWVGVKPTTKAIVTGASGNYYTDTTTIGINPTPFQVRVGITTGHGGKLVCNSNGNATVKAYGNPQNGLNAENYYIKKLAKSCRFKAKTIYFVNEVPQYNDGSTIGYLSDVGNPPKHHRGWPNLYNDSYFNSSSFGEVYQPIWNGGSSCSGNNCDVFSISLTGKP